MDNSTLIAEMDMKGLEEKRAPIDWSWIVKNNLEERTFTVTARYAATDGNSGFIRGVKSFTFEKAELDTIRLNSLEDLRTGPLFYKCTFVSLLERKSKDIDRMIKERLKKEYSYFGSVKSFSLAMTQLEKKFRTDETYDKMLRASALLLAKVKQANDGDSLGWLKEGEKIMESYVNCC